MNLNTFLSLIILFGGTLAGAQTKTTIQDQDALWERADRESQWPTTLLTLPGLQGETRAVRTDSGALKLETLADRYISEGKVKSREFYRYRGREQYLEQCKKQAPIFASIRDLNNRYELKFKVIGETIDSLETRFKAPDHFEVKFSLESDAVTRADRDFDSAAFQRKLSGQVQEQLGEIASSGEITLNLKGYDDVVCDLISGKAKINVQIWYHFTLARLRHETRLSVSEVNRIYDGIRQSFKTAKSARTNLILGSVALGSSLERQPLQSEALNDWEKVRLHGLLFELESGDLRNLNANDLGKAAARMDRLSDGVTYGMPVFDVQVVSPFGGSQ